MKQKLIVITGADGTGKSTLIDLLKEKLNSYYIATIWDLLFSSVKGLPFKSKLELDNFLCDLTPDSRFLFLSHALKYSTDMALQSGKEVIVLDSYFYKYQAAELALGADKELVGKVVDSFVKPDIVFEMRLPLAVVTERKNEFSRYECGRADNGNLDDFIEFQQKALKIWDEYKIENHYILDALVDKEKLVEKILELII